MSVGRFSDYQVETWLNSATVNGGYWLGLHYDNPDVAGAYASEVFGGTYQRILVPFDSPDGRTSWNSNAVRWTGLPSTVVTHVVGWDTQVNGNMIWYSSLDSLVRLKEGSTWSLGAHTIALSIN